eukprot:scaffold80865_cov65-Phaeocystis_antarctica.AAC.1
MKAPPRKTHTSENCAAMARAVSSPKTKRQISFSTGMRSTQPVSTRRGGLHHARAAPLPQRLSVGEEDEQEDERHPDRPEQKEEIRDDLDRIVIFRVVITAAHDLQVRVEEGAHIARGAVELVFGAVPGGEDALRDRWAEQKGDK